MGNTNKTLQGVWLPAYDPFPDDRARKLEEARQIYTRKRKENYPVMAESVPKEEEWSWGYLLFFLGIDLLLRAAKAFDWLLSWSSLKHVESLFTRFSFPRPLSVDRWRDDAWFGSQRLAGADPTIISLCEEIPPSLNVKEQELEGFLEGHTLQEVKESKRLFVCDLHHLREFRNGPDGQVIPAPIALFYVSDNRQLKPIAIQLFRDSPIFFPSDSKWPLAKLWYNLAEANYHQVVTHLYLTHLLMDSFCLATHRELSERHPISRLLGGHFHYLLKINNLGIELFTNENGVFNEVLSLGEKNALKLGFKRLSEWRLDVDGTLPRALEKRGVDKDVLPNYYYRDDALRIYKIIEKFVIQYVNHYYTNNKPLHEDHEIQTWARKLAAPRDHDGYGIQGMPLKDGRLESREDLVLVVTCIIFTCSAQHAAVNFPQYDHYGYFPNYPSMLIGEPPTNKSEAGIDIEGEIWKLLPKKAIIRRMMMVARLLTSFGTEPLTNPAGSSILDPEAKKLLEKFEADLDHMKRDISKETRDPPYNYLNPENVPYAISI